MSLIPRITQIPFSPTGVRKTTQTSDTGIFSLELSELTRNPRLNIFILIKAFIVLVIKSQVHLQAHQVTIPLISLWRTSFYQIMTPNQISLQWLSGQHHSATTWGSSYVCGCHAEIVIPRTEQFLYQQVCPTRDIIIIFHVLNKQELWTRKAERILVIF